MPQPLRMLLLAVGALFLLALAGCNSASNPLQGGLSGGAASYPDHLSIRTEPLGAGTYQLFNSFGSPVGDPQVVTLTTSHLYRFTLVHPSLPQGLPAEAVFHALGGPVMHLRIRVGSTYQSWLARPTPEGDGIEALYADDAYIRWLQARYPEVAFTRTELSAPFAFPSTVASLNRQLLMELATAPYLALMKPAFTIRIAAAQTAAAQ